MCDTAPGNIIHKSKKLNVMSFLSLSFPAADWDPGWEANAVSVQQRGPSVS